MMTRAAKREHSKMSKHAEANQTRGTNNNKTYLQEIECLVVELDAARFDSREIENVTQQAHERMGAVLDHNRLLALLAAQ
jgi:hypothetical protein